VLQHVAPPKFPVPGSHSSPTSMIEFPQTGGTVTEAEAEMVDVFDDEGV